MLTQSIGQCINACMFGGGGGGTYNFTMQSVAECKRRTTQLSLLTRIKVVCSHQSRAVIVDLTGDAVIGSMHDLNPKLVHLTGNLIIAEDKTQFRIPFCRTAIARLKMGKTTTVRHLVKSGRSIRQRYHFYLSCSPHALTQRNIKNCLSNKTFRFSG